jgi:hypothetical protein
MPIPFRPPIFSDAPSDYDQEWMNNFINEMSRTIQSINDLGLIRTEKMRITDLPTSAAGLNAGDLWNDSGTVKVA